MEISKIDDYDLISTALDNNVTPLMVLPTIIKAFTNLAHF